MARRILILLLVSSAAIFLFPCAGPASGTAAGVPASVVAAADPDDDGVCGECAWPRSETDRRHHAALSAVDPPRVFASARWPAKDFRTRDRGPTLASLAVSMILSRPPPPVFASHGRSPGTSTPIG